MSEQSASRPSDNQGNEPTDQYNEVFPTADSSESADHYTSSSEAWDVPVAAPGSSSERIGVVMTSTDIITSAETHSQRAKSAQSFREETDLLGTLQVPADAYYGVHTLRAVENLSLIHI